jgi:hypothetical protein
MPVGVYGVNEVGHFAVGIENWRYIYGLAIHTALGSFIPLHFDTFSA